MDKRKNSQLNLNIKPLSMPSSAGSLRHSGPASASSSDESFLSKDRMAELEDQVTKLKGQLAALRKALAPTTRVVKAPTQFAERAERPREPARVILPDIEPRSPDHDTATLKVQIASQQDEIERLKTLLQDIIERHDETEKELGLVKRQYQKMQAMLEEEIAALREELDRERSRKEDRSDDEDSETVEKLKMEVARLRGIISTNFRDSDKQVKEMDAKWASRVKQFRELWAVRKTVGESDANALFASFAQSLGS